MREAVDEVFADGYGEGGAGEGFALLGGEVCGDLFCDIKGGVGDMLAVVLGIYAGEGDEVVVFHCVELVLIVKGCGCFGVLFGVVRSGVELLFGVGN